MRSINVTRQKAVLILKDHGYISWKEFKNGSGEALLKSGAKLCHKDENYFVYGYHNSGEDIMKVGLKV